MKDSSRVQLARWIAVLVLGITLNSMGLILFRLGPLHFFIMGVGVLLEIIGFVRIVMIARGEGGSPPS